MGKALEVPGSHSAHWENQMNWLLPLLAGLFWLPVAGFDFLQYDDLEYFKYPEIVAFKPTLMAEFFRKDIVGNYIPIPSLSFALEYALFGQNPMPFHITNILLHAGSTYLIWNILRNHTPFHFYVRVFLALIFALHPLQVEIVSWISCRGALLSTLFSLVSLRAWLRFRANNNTSGLLSAFVFFSLAAFSKPSAVVLPVIFLLSELTLFQRPFRELFKVKFILQIAPFFLLSLGVGLLTLRFLDNMLTVQQDYSVVERITLVFYSFGFYIEKLLLPFQLSPYHFYPETNGGGVSARYYLVALIAPLVALSLRFLKPSYRLLAWFGFGFFIISLILVVQIVPVRTVIAAERYAYPAFLGLLIMVGCGIQAFYSESRKALILSLMAALLMAYAIQSIQYRKRWADTEKLMLYAISREKDHAYLFQPLSHLGIHEVERGDLQKGLDYLSLAKTKIEGYPYLDLNYALALAKKGNMQSALEEFEKLVSRAPDNDEYLANLAGAYTSLGRHTEAIERCNEALSINNNNFIALSNRAIAKARLGQHSEALEDYNLSLAINPTQAVAYYFRGFSRLQLGDVNAACSDWQQAQKMGYLQSSEALKQYCSN